MGIIFKQMCKLFIEDYWQLVITSLDLFTDMRVLGACTNSFFLYK
jgi:hypothetical protein